MQQFCSTVNENMHCLCLNVVHIFTGTYSMCALCVKFKKTFVVVSAWSFTRNKSKKNKATHYSERGSEAKAIKAKQYKEKQKWHNWNFLRTVSPSVTTWKHWVKGGMIMFLLGHKHINRECNLSTYKHCFQTAKTATMSNTIHLNTFTMTFQSENTPKISD